MTSPENISDQQFVNYKPRTMDPRVTPSLMKPGTAPAPSWDEHYGKSFKWGFVPRENSLDPHYKGDQIGLIAPISPDFHRWKDASADPRVQDMKANWEKTWSSIPRYKQNQITASVKRPKQ